MRDTIKKWSAYTETPRWHIGLGVVLLAAAALRLWPLFKGELIWHPDEYSFVFIPLNFFSGDLNPHFFTYPTLQYYLLGIVYALDFLLTPNTGLYEWIAYHYLWHPENLMSLARLVTVAFAVGGVAWAALLARSIAGRGAGLVAAIFLGCNIVHVRQSGLAAPDIPLACWSTGAIWAAVRLLHSERADNYAIAGVLLGLATSCKYPAAALAPAILAAHLAAHRGLADRRLALAGALALGAFLLTSPYVLWDYPLFAKHFLEQIDHVQTGRGQGGWGFHAWTSLRSGVGTLGWLATWASIGCIAYRWRREGLVLLTAAGCFYIAISWGKLAFVRYGLPLLPLQAVLLAVGWSTLPAKRWRYIILALVLIEPAYGSLHLVRIQAATDTRTQSREWIANHVPEGARVANFGGWAGDVPLRTIHELWWRLRRFEHAFGQARVDALLDYLQATRPDEPFYRYLVQEGDRALVEGDWNLVVEREADYVLLHTHPLEYSRVDASFLADLEARADHVASWAPQGLAESTPLYDWSDAYYVPIENWSHLDEPGPTIELWRIGETKAAKPRTAHDLLALAYVQDARGKLHSDDRAAMQILQRALVLSGETPDALHTLASLHKKYGRYENAQQTYARIRKLDPESWLAYKMSGALHLEMGEHGAALEETEHALAMGATTPGIYNNLGIAHIGLGQFDEGVTNFRHGPELAPDRADIWFNLGAALDMTGQRSQAITALHKALALDAKYVRAVQLLQQLEQNP